MLQEWPGCLKGEFSGGDRSWDSSQQFDCVMENRLMYSFVVPSAHSALFFFFFFVPSTQCFASLIPPLGFYLALCCFLSPPFLRRNCAWSFFPPLFFSFFFRFGCVFPRFLCWIVVGTSGRWQNPHCAARFLWLDMFTMGLFSIQNKSALSIVPPLRSNKFISAGNFCTFSRGLFVRPA